MLSHTKLPKLTLIFLIALATVVEQVRVAVAQSEADNPAATAGGTTVQIDSTDSANTVNQVLKQAFEKQSAGNEIKLSSGSTDAVIQAVLDGKYDLAAIGRPLTADETAKGLATTSLKRHKIAVVVGADNPFQGSLTIDQFAKIFRGEITDWSDVGGQPGPIRLIDRPDTNDTRQAFPNYKVFQTGTLETGATATQLAEDDVQAVAKALGNDGISYMIANQVPKQSGVRAIQMHKTLPDDPRYPFSQPLAYVYKGSTASPVVKEFLNFVDSPAGQAEIESISGPVSTLAASSSTTNDANTAVGGISPAPGTVSGDATAGVPSTESGGVPPWLWGLPVLALAGGAAIWGMNRNRSSPDEGSGGRVVPGTPPSPIQPTGRPPTSATGNSIAGGLSSIGSKLGDMSDTASTVAGGAAQAGGAAILGGVTLAAGAGAAALSRFSDREQSDENLSESEMNALEGETPNFSVRGAETDSQVVGGVLNPWDMPNSSASESTQFLPDAGLTQIQGITKIQVPESLVAEEPAPNLEVPLATTEIEPETLLPDDDDDEADLFAEAEPTTPEPLELATDAFDLSAVDSLDLTLPDSPELIADPFDLDDAQFDDLAPPTRPELITDELELDVASADNLAPLVSPDLTSDSLDLGASPANDWATPEVSDSAWETAALAGDAAFGVEADVIADTASSEESVGLPTLEPPDFDPFNASGSVPDLMPEAPINDLDLPWSDEVLTASTADLADIDLTSPLPSAIGAEDFVEVSEELMPSLDADVNIFESSDAFPELATSESNEVLEVESNDLFADISNTAGVPTDDELDGLNPLLSEQLLSEQSVGEPVVPAIQAEMDSVDLPSLELASEDGFELPFIVDSEPLSAFNDVEALSDGFPLDTPSAIVEPLVDAQRIDAFPTTADSDWDALLVDLQSGEPTAELPEVDLFSSLDIGTEANVSSGLPDMDDLAHLNLSPELPDLDLEASLEDLLGTIPSDSNEDDKSTFS